MRGKKSLLKLVAFLAASAVLAGYLVIVLADLRFGDTHGYRADFTDVSQLTPGSQVRVAGVEVGKVTGVSVGRDNVVRVSFNVGQDIAVTSGTRAVIRYKDLIGNRFLELEPGAGGTPLRPGGLIPAARTAAALDLDTLFNGFKPLFVGLTPKQINAVSAELVNVLQGESGSIYTLLATVASLTSTLANRDQLIGVVIDNLNAVLRTVMADDGDLAALIDNLRSLVTGLNEDAPTILRSVVSINSFTASAASLLAKVNPSLTADLPALQAVSRTLNKNTAEVQQVLDTLAPAYSRLARVGTYGDFFNIYVCGIRLKLTDQKDNTVLTPYIVQDDVSRCS